MDGKRGRIAAFPVFSFSCQSAVGAVTIPAKLNHYTILNELGKGGTGEVYAAEDTRLHRRVAIKVLSRLMASDPERRQRFEREAQAIAALNHQHRHHPFR